uniref:Uncharacterized protein n=1 Tax=Cacopsylla melanoneura TaxID=428564 RepID=A0A8D8XEF7_9HEMI
MNKCQREDLSMHQMLYWMMMDVCRAKLPQVPISSPQRWCKLCTVTMFKTSWTLHKSSVSCCLVNRIPPLMMLYGLVLSHALWPSSRRAHSTIYNLRQPGP